MATDFLLAGFFTMSMVCGVVLILMAMRQRSERLAMEHRERMAMIERGQVPASPSTAYGAAATLSPHGGASRAMSAGIILIGLGLGLMSVVGIAGESPEVGIGVGGAFAVLGVAFIANSIVSRSASPSPAPASEATAETLKTPEPPPL